MVEKIYSEDVVIGAGLGGLMYGITALEFGTSVVISEAQPKVGGYATQFFRNKRKYIFDCSQHKITGLNPAIGNLWNALERLGLGDLMSAFCPYEDLTTIVYRDRWIALPSTPQGIKSWLLFYFPEESEGINQLFKAVETLGYQHYMLFRMLVNEYKIQKSWLRESRMLSKITTRAYFHQLFRGHEIIEVLSAIAIYFGAISNEINAFYFLHFLYATIYGGQFYVKGTGQHISNLLLKTYQEKGGVLIKNNEVYSIEDQLIGLRVNSRKKIIEANRVIATCSPNDMVRMWGQDQVEPKYLKTLEQFKIGWGHFCVYMVTALPPESLGIYRSEYLLVADIGDDYTEEDLQRDRHYHRLTLSVTNYHKIYPDGGYIVQSIILDHGNGWFSLSEDDYLQRKVVVQEILLDRVFKVFPKLRGNIIYVESSTPRTNWKYTLSTGGSAFSYKVLPKVHLGSVGQFPSPKVKLAGSWVAGPGYEATMCYGFTQGLLLNKIKDK